MWKRLVIAAGVLGYLAVCAGSQRICAQDLDPRVAEAEARRIAAIEKVRPAVVAVFARGGQGGGSGVLISKDGYALTNYHVVKPCGITMQCGLADGVLYDAVLVGQDTVGDVALIKLLPKEEGKPFPFAVMGDSDKVRVGDWSLAMGNPFLLATDFTPTITFGLVSGTHRYQPPSGIKLEYTDCIQIDTSINPGNSGGPLFNLDGEIIGINGRGSFEKRGRVNSGVGYAISINQIKHFLGHLKAGFDVDHATLGAALRTDEDGRMIVTQILGSADAHRRGLEPDDELISFAGRQINSVNQYKNILGIFPKGWRLPMVYRHTDADKGTSTRKEVLVRLMGVQRSEVEDRPRGPRRPQPRPGEEPNPGDPRLPIPHPEPEKQPADSPALKFYEKKEGFINHYFNKLERERLLAGARKHGDFSSLGGAWILDGDVVRPVKNPLKGTVDDKVVRLTIGDTEYAVEPLKPGESVAALREPRDSGGLLVALYQWRRFLTHGEKGFEGGFAYGGYEPYYPDGSPASQTMSHVLSTEHGAVASKWFFSQEDGSLLGFECYIEKDQDPCEVSLSDYKEVSGRKLPHRLEVRYGDKDFGVITIKSYALSEAPKAGPAEKK